MTSFADLVAKVKAGYKANGKDFKVHLDGYNLMPFLKGEAKESPRKGRSSVTPASCIHSAQRVGRESWCRIG